LEKPIITQLSFLTVLMILSSCAPYYYDSAYPDAKSVYRVWRNHTFKPDEPRYENSKELAAMQLTMGLSKASLMEVYGAPNRVISDGVGGEIVVFENTSSILINGTGGASTFFREFYLDSSGKVKRFKFGYREFFN